MVMPDEKRIIKYSWLSIKKLKLDKSNTIISNDSFCFILRFELLAFGTPPKSSYNPSFNYTSLNLKKNFSFFLIFSK